MKPSTNRRERRAGFLAGREVFTSCPRYKRRRIGRAGVGGFWLISIDSPGGAFSDFEKVVAQAQAEISRLLIGPADFSRNFGRDIAKKIAAGIR